MKLLIFAEATLALDNEAKAAIKECINALNGRKWRDSIGERRSLSMNRKGIVIDCFKLHGKMRNLVKRYIILFVALSVLLILSCCLTNDTVKMNIRKSARMMEQEGCYPHYLVDNQFYQLDNWTEAEVLNFIYSEYEDNPVKTAFAQRSLGGYLSGGRRAESSYERLIARVEIEEEIDEAVRPSYWIGCRVIFIPLLNFMNYYQIRTLLFCLSVLLLLITIIMICRKVNIKLGLGAILLTFLSINFPIAFLNNSLGMMCMCLTCLSVIYVTCGKNVVYLEFMFIVGMLTAFFEWFSLSIFSFGITTCVILVLRYLENNKTKFADFFNLLWNSACGWIFGIVTMFLGRILVSVAVIGPSAVNSFLDRVTYNTGALGGESLGIKIIVSLFRCACGLFPISAAIQVKSWTLMGILAFLIVVGGVILLIEIKRNSRNIGLNIALLIIALSPIAWIMVFNTYYYVHYWIAYRVLGISVFAFLCVILFGVDFKKKLFRGRAK